MATTVPQIIGDGDVERRMMACAIDVAETGQPEDLVVIGYRITDSVLEFNADTEKGTDINGRNFSSVNKLEPSQSFDPHRLTSGDLGKLGANLIEYYRKGNLAKFSQFRCVLIFGFLEGSAEGKYIADRHEACTIVPQSLGGESWTEMPFEVTFGGKVTHGSVDGLIDKIKFTAEA